MEPWTKINNYHLSIFFCFSRIPKCFFPSIERGSHAHSEVSTSTGLTLLRLVGGHRSGPCRLSGSPQVLQLPFSQVWVWVIFKVDELSSQHDPILGYFLVLAEPHRRVSRFKAKIPLTQVWIQHALHSLVFVGTTETSWVGLQTVSQHGAVFSDNLVNPIRSIPNPTTQVLPTHICAMVPSPG